MKKEHVYIEEIPEIIEHFCSEDILPPRGIDLELSSKCNLRCTMCPKTKGLEPNPSNSDISWETFRNVEKIFPYVDRICLSGFGESFLHPDFLEMVRVVKSYGISANVTSNGLLLRENIAKDIVQSGLDYLSISIDALDPETLKLVRGTREIEKIIRNIDGILKAKEELSSKTPLIGISFTAMNLNVDQLPGIVHYAIEKNMDSVNVCPFDDYRNNFEYSMTSNLDKARENFIKARNIALQHNMNVIFNFETEFIKKLKEKDPKDEFFKIFHSFIPTNKGIDVEKSAKEGKPTRKHCFMPFFNLVVTSKGDVIPCCKSTPSEIMGNVNNTPILEIWRSAKFREFRRKLLSSKPPIVCKLCATADWKHFRPVKSMYDHFDSLYHDDTQMGIGFYDPVYNYSKKYWWTRKKATLFLRYNRENYLSINAGSLITEDTKNPRKVTVYINNKPIGSFLIRNRFRNYLLPVKGCEGEIAKITLVVDKTIKPVKEGLGDDYRNLGIALSRIEFVEGGYKNLFFVSDADTSHLIDGWTEPEVWGSWTNKETAVIKLPIEPGRSYVMTFYVCPFFDPERQQSMEVFIEDNFLGKIEFEKGEMDWQAYKLLLPAKFVTKTSHLMRFKCAYLITPFESSKGVIQDHRKLGVGFKLIRFGM
jgi:radical SAM protein with 4Fe4S-binding SPASM domain